MTLQQFIDKYNGVHIDEDGYYGAQCWDLVARYAREVYGCPSFPTVTGGAAGLFSNTAPIILQYFDRVANNPNDANQIPPDGAVIVWGTTWSPPYGHTAVKTSGGKGQNMTVIEQNGNNPGGAAYLKSRNYSGVTGWLVPKGNTMATDKLTKEDVIEIHRAYFIGDPGPGYGWEHVGKPLEVIVRDFKNSIYRIPIVQRYNDYPTVIGQNADLTKKVTDTQTKFDELLKVDQIKDTQIKDLSAKLAVQSDDTVLLNGFGEWLQKLIARLGVKKG